MDTPKELPTVSDVHHWLASTAAALVEASAYNDRAEVAWFSKVNDPSTAFAALPDPERDRLKNLDMMLVNILQSKIGKQENLVDWSARTRRICTEWAASSQGARSPISFVCD